MAYESGIAGADVKAAIEKTGSIRRNVRDFDAAGDGTTDDSSALQSAINALGSAGGVLEFEAQKTYLCKDVIRTDGIGPITLIGNGATIKRGNSETTTLASAAADGATAVDVSDASLFRVGGYIMLIDTAAPNGGKTLDEVSGPHKVDAISGSTLTLGTAIGIPSSKSGDTEWASGSTVLKSYMQIHTEEGRKLSIYGLNFDGNRANNTVFEDWTANHCVTRIGRGSVVEGCTFHSMPNECLFLGYWATVTNCTAYDLNGSFTHTSSAVTHDNDPSGMNLIQGNRVARAGEAGPSINQHSEGVFTFSANSGKVIISDNIVENCTQGFAGNISNTGEVVITGNFVQNTNGAVFSDVNGGYIPSIEVSGNIFDTCLWCAIGDSSSRVREDQGWESVVVSGNQFINTQLVIQECSGVSISGNTFLWKDDFDPSAVTPTYDLGDALLFAAQVTSVSICNNTFEDQQSSVNGISHAIQWSTNTSLKSDASTATPYSYYARNVVVANNSISNTLNGIYHADVRDTGYLESVLNFVVKGNQITLRDDASSEYGIRGYPGMMILGNTVICSSNTTKGIDCVGVHDSMKTTINSEVCCGNVVMGEPTYSIRAAAGDNTQNAIDKSWNMTIANNVTQKAIVEDNPSQNTFANNIQVPFSTQAFELQPSRANPGWY